MGGAGDSCPKQDRTGAAGWQLLYDKECRSHLRRHRPGVTPHMLSLLRDAESTNSIGLKCRAQEKRHEGQPRATGKSQAKSFKLLRKMRENGATCEGQCCFLEDR